MSRPRAIAPPPPNRPLPPIPTAEEEAAAAALQHRRPSVTKTATTVNATIMSSTTKTSQNRRVVPRMGTRSHPRGSQPSTSTICDVNEQVTVSLLSSSSPSSSSSSSSGCEDAIIESRQRSSDDYMKITSQSCLINLEAGYQDSDDGYTSLNALDSLKDPHHHHHRHNHQPSRNPIQTEKTSKTQESRRPHSIASSLTSSSSFDDESTLVCTYGKDSDLPLDGMYRLKVKSTTSTTAAIQFHGNKRLVRKYRMKRREGVEAPPKTVSLDREQKKHYHQQDRLRRGGGGGCSSPCRLVTMLVV
ncbi:hypothetical protein ECG_09495 [Echinococcus granulosus]|nr:hypothetical protein ECG_09495 [Echinococcus granulosus]